MRSEPSLPKKTSSWTNYTQICADITTCSSATQIHEENHIHEKKPKGRNIKSIPTYHYHNLYTKLLKNLFFESCAHAMLKNLFFEICAHAMFLNLCQNLKQKRLVVNKEGSCIACPIGLSLIATTPIHHHLCGIVECLQKTLFGCCHKRV
jgi:hypothetical protein